MIGVPEALKLGPTLAAAFLATMLVLPTTGFASTFTVDTTADNAPVAGECSPAPGDCSLRQAVDAATGAAGDDTIDFALPDHSTISLTSGALTMAAGDGLTIDGPGANKLTIERSSAAPPSAVFNVNLPTATFRGFTVTNGSSGAFAAGGTNVAGDATFDGLVITGNTGDAGGGGGGSASAIAYFGTSLTIRNTTISDNHVLNAGTGRSGTIVDVGNDLLVENSTIADNTITGTGTSVDGGAVTNFGGNAVFRNSTIVNNSVEGGVGGIGNTGFVSLANTVLAGNTGPAAPNCDSIDESRGYNLIGDGTNCTITPATGDQIGTGASPIDPKLGPLGDNGGSTPTRVPLSGSPLINAGNPAAPTDDPEPAAPALVACRTTDQRGVTRPSGSACDIGAVEAEAPVVTTGAATSVSKTGATLNGDIDPRARSTTYHFEYGTSTSYVSQAPATDGDAGSGSGAHGVSQALTGLSGGTTYHYRLVGTNSAGTSTGADQTFTTAPKTPPAVTTTAATRIGVQEATLNGSVNPNGLPTSHRFEYGKTKAYGQATLEAATGAGTSALPAAAALTGLAPHTKYHFRVIATNDDGTSVGADMTFTTAAPARLAIGHRGTRLANGRTRVRLRCGGTAGTRCTGTLRLGATRLRTRAGGAAAAPSATFDIAAGTSKRVTIKVPARTLGQLATRRKAVARATAKLDTGATVRRLLTLFQ